MAREYFKAFHSYLKSMEPLDDAERGRLFTAMLTYSMTGEAPRLTGNERFIFPTMQANIDRGIEGYEAVAEVNRANGRLGGRPRKSESVSGGGDKTEAVCEKPNGFSKTQDKDKDEDYDNDYDNDKDNDNDYDEDERGARAGRADTHARTDCVEGNRRGDTGGEARGGFIPPTVEEVAAYVKERGSRVDPQGFVDYYAAKGWMVGHSKMRDWRAACRNAEGWERWSWERPGRGQPREAPAAAAAADDINAQNSSPEVVDRLMRLYGRMQAQEDWTPAPAEWRNRGASGRDA